MLLFLHAKILSVSRMQDFFVCFLSNSGLEYFFGFLGSVLANQPNVHSGGVSRGDSVAVAVVVGDR